MIEIFVTSSVTSEQSFAFKIVLKFSCQELSRSIGLKICSQINTARLRDFYIKNSNGCSLEHENM